jgi:hypothetical protein
MIANGGAVSSAKQASGASDRPEASLHKAQSGDITDTRNSAEPATNTELQQQLVDRESSYAMLPSAGEPQPSTAIRPLAGETRNGGAPAQSNSDASDVSVSCVDHKVNSLPAEDPFKVPPDKEPDSKFTMPVPDISPKTDAVGFSGDKKASCDQSQAECATSHEEGEVSEQDSLPEPTPGFPLKPAEALKQAAAVPSWQRQTGYAPQSVTSVVGRVLGRRASVTSAEALAAPVCPDCAPDTAPT